MAEYMDEGASEEDLSHLEDEGGEEGSGKAAVSTRELPEPLYRIRASHSNETYYAYWQSDAVLEDRTWVIAPTRYGRDICELQGLVKESLRVSPDELLRIDRVATAEDLEKAEANKEKEAKAFELCRQKIEARKLPMKLVAAHYLLDEPKVLFFFSADSRVDFRELVKDLVSVFKMRIELRQIGVRDEARVTGGCGVCGRVLCCHGVSDKLTPVSIKMAKDQNLSLNSMKISGPCGRLLCCLAYEYGFYRDARRELPGEGARFQFEGVLFRVVEVNCLGGSVKASGEDGRVLILPAARFIHSEGR
jgi:cell fate regulator YaaT (PSP1 superfamily)